ncbi:ECF transporter S component [Gehongia tenuis]|uniref:ECF transporter S component n=1 Tax=Gehongia tenuis TaxID=2763655 RepID=A0A926D2J0_9FIRM|nr:ECF transporter S component [Gehongia tenuis]MBC8530332.1 ECF transporter S component [Gehongia tenuis]
MKNQSRIRWITRTAVFLALLVVLQALTASFGNTLVTGSVVNLLLIVSVMVCGPASGLSVAVLSPILAKLLGIGPFWSLIPFIIAGNVVLVLLWHFLGRLSGARGPILATAAAACAKFLVLYGGIVKVAIPFLLQLNGQQAAAVSHMFSLPQLATALIGGAAASLILPLLQRALAGKQG